MIEWKVDYRAEKIRRLKLLVRLNENIEDRWIAQRYYKTHPVDWINDWCVTFDPRRSGQDGDTRLMPFILFPRQAEYIQFLHSCWRDKQSGLTEKARDMGATWCAAAFSVWMWLYQEGSVVGWGSRKAEYVDAGNDPKAVFPKMRQIIEYLPVWMLPLGYNPRLHSTYMKIYNPENNSAITGESGDGIGRGGRTSVYLVDEAAHLEHPELTEAALGDNTDVRIDISSVNGPSNIFYRRRFAGSVWMPGKTPEPNKTRVFIMDWRDHPNKTQQWYDDRRAKAESEGLLHLFAQEVDRDYLSSVDNIIIPTEWFEACIDAHIKLEIADGTEVVAGQDVADSGGDKNALAIRHGVILRYCDHWAGDAGDAPGIGLPAMMENRVRDLYYDSIGVGTGYKVGVNNLVTQKRWPASIRVHPWAGSDSVLNPEKNVIANDPDSPKNEDHYLNLKAQAWFLFRARCYKTFRAVRHGEKFPANELVSIDSRIPRLHELKAEISQAIHKASTNGKTMVDKKPDGAFSPNLADGVIICYCGGRVRDSLFNY